MTSQHQQTNRLIDKQINIKESLQHMDNSLYDLVPLADKAAAQKPAPLPVIFASHLSQPSSVH